MCNNFPNIRITEGNNFSLVLPLRSRTYVATRPIDEDIDPAQLENVVVTFGGVEYPAQITEGGVQIDLPATLTVGTYNILLTAEYLESSIRAAYESAVTIVPWSAQSTAEQYITGSPIVMRAAYVLSGAMTDAELEALKEEYREKNAQLDQAIAEWERKAAELDGVAQQGTDPNATNTAILQAIQQSGGDDVAKESTSQEIKDKLQAVLDAHIIDITDFNGYVFGFGFTPRTPGDLITKSNFIIGIIDPYWTSTDYKYINGLPNIQYIELPNATGVVVADDLKYLINLRSVIIPNATLNGHRILLGCTNLIYANFENFNGAISSVECLADCVNLRELNVLQALSISGANCFRKCANLIKLTTGKNYNGDISISAWSPTNALNPNLSDLVEEGETFENNLEKLLYNIREHIAANLRTITQGYAITFSTAVKAAILADQPTADAFTNKGWTIA